MIVFKAYHRPDGDASREECIGTIHVANVGGSAELGRYEVTRYDGDNAPWRVLQQEQCEHRRTRPVWVLLVQALRALGYERS